MAVLKFAWSDTPFQGDTPIGLSYDDNVLNRLFFPLGTPWWGIGQYWEYCSYGAIDVRGTQVFPWRKLAGFNAPPAGVNYLRGAIAAQAVKQALDEGWPLDDFRGIVVWVAPSASNPQDAGSSPSKLNGKWPFCVLYEGSNHDFYAHEYGHALGIQHTWGYRGGQPSPQPYNDPYCIMSAQFYGNTTATFKQTAQVGGPPTGDNFWASMAPMPAAATLYSNIADFAGTPNCRQLGTITAGWRRSVTLRARDLTHGNHPVLAVAVAGAGVTGGRQGYTVELRRAVDWDKGLTSPGVVIHSFQSLDEFPAGTYDLEKDPVVVYEGVLPLPITSGDADWHSPSGDFVVRVDDVDDDLGQVDLTLGGADLLHAGAVTVDVAVGGYSELAEEGVAHDVPILICGRGDYRYFIDHQHTQLTCTATSFGYDNPRASWRVNGVPLGAGPTVSVPAVSTYPRPTSKTQQSQNVTLTWSVTANTLVLTADPADGNYALEIEATVSEGTPLATPTPPASGQAYQQVDTILISWEQAYYDAVQRCAERLAEINRRFAKSHAWPRIGPGDPITRVQLVLDIMRHDLAQASPVLAERIAFTAGQLPQAGATRLDRGAGPG
ncbi:hypothetical protein ACQP2F_04820 [Actinoplanes sp. CA-030573]|uniref:hypothetical protein n=1 Tax=Actinoplanes sp. CA-030573 TaxID=3239898 RepID=UPI003D8DF1D9